MNKIKYDILIIGLGNLIMSDDGVGIHVIKKLQQENFGERILALEVGTSPLYYLEEISKAAKVIVIDAVKGGEKPGSIYRLAEEDFKSSQNIIRDFHEYSLLNVIKLAREITGLPVNFIVYGIEPKNLNLDQKLSKIVSKSQPNLLKLIKKELEV
ncbi:hydrogenase maturation protease [Orenia marismortui]|uniref:hydrogenase maturation protease n=1 Tax=Orenia marismortui TaxID=46469 RepID=UPI0003A128E9|nr:hydrogenase maturation protease [Orenia marismortui]